MLVGSRHPFAAQVGQGLQVLPFRHDQRHTAHTLDRLTGVAALDHAGHRHRGSNAVPADHLVQTAGNHDIQHAAAHGTVQLVVGIGQYCHPLQGEGFGQVGFQRRPALTLRQGPIVKHADPQVLGQDQAGQQQRQGPQASAGSGNHQPGSGR